MVLIINKMLLERRWSRRFFNTSDSLLLIGFNFNTIMDK